MTSNHPNDKDLAHSELEITKTTDINSDTNIQIDDAGTEASQIDDQSSALANAQSASPLRFAGFWMRFWAYLLDLVVVGSIDRILINPLFRVLDVPLHDTHIFAPISIATAITFYAYFVLMTKYLGQTLGKMVFGLKVVDLEGKKLTWGTIIFREWIGRFISASIFILYVIVAFLPKKQGIHDLFADTTVIHERSSL